MRIFGEVMLYQSLVMRKCRWSHNLKSAVPHLYVLQYFIPATIRLPCLHLPVCLPSLHPLPLHFPALTPTPCPAFIFISNPHPSPLVAPFPAPPDASQAGNCTARPGRGVLKGRVSSRWGAVQAKAGQQVCAKWLPCMKTMATWAPST